ncbi:hypothetical protein RIF29_32985 [Crotalaria pallida]|uniref:Uncharacterized protein n=1 Tax=Crotalaria pallida TaxID=3830 RepID=A0AAN9HQF6_CROPI
MPKKRDRPPKSPSSSSKQTPSLTTNHVSMPLDFTLIKDRLLNLEGLDDLSNKQATDLMKSLDAIKEKLKGKQVIPTEGELESETQVEHAKLDDEPQKADPAKAKEISIIYEAAAKEGEEQPETSGQQKQNDLNNSEGDRQERDLYFLYRNVSQKNLMFLKQKAKQKWIQEGDQNTAFFHKAIKSRCYRNRVMRVTDIHSNLCTNKSDIQQAFLDYYVDLFNGNQKNWKVSPEEMTMGNVLSMI